MINQTINIGNLSMNTPMTFGMNPNLPKECWSQSGRYSVECIYNTICPQLHNYFIRTGLIIVISYAVLSWIIWWYFKYGWKKYPIKPNLLTGDLKEFKDRAIFLTWINNVVIKLCIIYIALVVYMNWDMTRLFFR